MIPTSFNTIYNSFFSKVTDDMYLQLTQEDTQALLEELLISAIPKFEFPRVSLEYKTITTQNCSSCQNQELCSSFNDQDNALIFVNFLTKEQIDILSTYMVVEWLGQQLATIENTRLKYSGADFKFTSQANHMQKILQLKKDYERLGFHLQRLYKRRIKDVNGVYRSTIPSIMSPIESFEIGSRQNESLVDDSCPYFV